MNKSVIIRLLLKKHGSASIDVVSASMMPLVYPNDHVVINPHDHYRPGDVLLYERDNELILHRLIIQKRLTFYLKGDRSPRLDKAVMKTEIIGRAVRVYSKTGKLRSDLNKPLVMISGYIRSLVARAQHHLL